MSSTQGTSASEIYGEVEVGTTNRKSFHTGIGGGGSEVQWASCPLSPFALNASAFTIDLYGSEAAPAVNLRPMCILKKWFAATGGTITISQATTESEYPLAVAPLVLAGAVPTPVSFADGDRLVIECFSIPLEGSFDSADPDVTVRYGHDAADDADSHLQLAQVVACSGMAVPTASPTSTPVATGATSSPTPSETPTPTTGAPPPTPTPSVEICDDCIDNDADGDIDRADMECAPSADGAGNGVADPTLQGKSALRCQSALGKAGRVFALSRLKLLDGCVLSLVACEHESPSQACFAKANEKCSARMAKLSSMRLKLQLAILKRCAEPTLTPTTLLDEAGLGFAAEIPACAAAGVPTLGSINDVATCLTSRHECQIDQLLGNELPRARDILTLAGRDPSSDAPCLPPSGAGGAAASEAFSDCLGAIAKASLRLVAARMTTLQQCADSAAACLQTKPSDPDCLVRASESCTERRAKLTTPDVGAEARFSTAVVAGCDRPSLALSDLLDASGLGEREAVCGALGVGPVDSVEAVADCLARLQACRTDQMLEGHTPRLRELLDLIQ
jgi:hypothetical protein